MKKFILITCIYFFGILSLFSQSAEQIMRQESLARIEAAVIEDYNGFAQWFNEAYALYPSIPRGILEAVAYNYTRFHHLQPDSSSSEPSAIPATYGVMGLTLNGKGYFRENLKLVSQLSGFPIHSIITSPRDNIIAYAAAYHALQQEMGVLSSDLSDQLPILDALSELPQSGDRRGDFARQSNLYAILQFFDDGAIRQAVGITRPAPDYNRCFGDYLPMLQSSRIEMNQLGVPNVSSRDGEADYNGALWVPAASCNYSSRNGHTPSAVTVHYTQGTYAGAISWFQNCSAQVSAHYVIRSSDGQITQMVAESDKAWHVGNSNAYTIGLEHEAYGNIYSYFTPAMYEHSAALTRDICERNNISPLRMFYRDTLDNGSALNYGLHDLGGESACTKIRGHQHFPSQTHTDPGPYWNWNYYYKLVNADSEVQTFHQSSGIVTDSGGENGDYGNDERQLYLIEIPQAESITLSFADFELEDDYDFLWIYDGNSVFSPLLGRWNTTSPGTIHSSGNAILIEFRSDCATTASGWTAYWNAIFSEPDALPTTEIVWDEGQWATTDVNVQFQDDDDHGIDYRFYQVMGKDHERWSANQEKGFLCDNFDDLNTDYWQCQSGTWNCVNNQLKQTATGTSLIATPINTNQADAYLYDFYASLQSSGESTGYLEFLFHCDAINQQAANSGYAMRVLSSEGRLELGHIANGQWTGISGTYLTSNENSYYFFRIIHDRANHRIKIFRNGVLVLSTTDDNPLTSEGNYLAFSTQNCIACFDNLRVYHSRAENVTISVSNDPNSDAHYPAKNGNAQAKIKSIVVDNASQFSALKEKALRIDYTPPTFQGIVNDGYQQDVDTWSSSTFAANWTDATDNNSGIARYEYIIECQQNPYIQRQRRGTTMDPQLREEMRFLSNVNYHVKVRAQNQAGLYSDFIYSDGFTYKSSNAARIRDIVTSVTPNPATEYVTISLHLVDNLDDEEWEAPYGQNSDYSTFDGAKFQVRIYDLFGRVIEEREITDGMLTLPIKQWPSGLYVFQIFSSNGTIEFEKVIKK